MTKTGILIHGTFAGPRAGVKQWYELGKDDEGSFINSLEGALRQRGDLDPITWRAFPWSGLNVHDDRVLAAEALYNVIRDVIDTPSESQLFLIAHSHGGNVALKALELLWRRNPEGQRVFKALVKTIGMQHSIGKAAPQIIASDPELSNLSPELRSFLESVDSFFSSFLRLGGLPPQDDSAAQERWLEAKCRSPFINRCSEVFCSRWSRERRLPVHLVTMGTPFYQKIWNPRPSVRSPRYWLTTIAAAGIVAAAFWGAGWIFFKVISRPLPMDSSMLIGWLLSTLIVLLFGIAVRWQQERSDRNVYFDIYSGAESPRPRELPWRLSVIQAGLLDEALLALSAEPLILAELAPRLRRPLTPRLSWSLPPDPTGQYRMMVPLTPQYMLRIARRGIALASRWFYNATIGFVLRLVGWIATFVAHQFLLRTLLRSLSSGGFGLPEHEFHEARVNVQSEPSLQAFFQQEMWDATQALVAEAPVRPTAADRHAKWGFLWDNDLLARGVETSPIWKRLSKAIPRPTQNQGAQLHDQLRLQRVSLALEERLREASGLVPLNHSGYYSNQKVIEQVAEMLSRGKPVRHPKHFPHS